MLWNSTEQAAEKSWSNQTRAEEIVWASSTTSGAEGAGLDRAFALIFGTAYKNFGWALGVAFSSLGRGPNQTGVADCDKRISASGATWTSIPTLPSESLDGSHSWLMYKGLCRPPLWCTSTFRWATFWCSVTAVMYASKNLRRIQGQSIENESENPTWIVA